jgi:hypothetical protein
VSRWFDWKEIHREGNWWLAEQKSWGHGYCVMHSCESGARPKRPEYKYFNTPCGWCDEVVPESIQTVYVLLTDHREMGTP